MAQSILDFFPDAINQFGLIGCALFCLWCIAIVVFLWSGSFLVVRGVQHGRRAIAYKARHGSAYRAF